MGIYAKEKTEALKALVQSVHNGEEKLIKQSLESLLTAIALECDPGQINTLKNFANSITFNQELFHGASGPQEIRFNLTNYNYQLD